MTTTFDKLFETAVKWDLQDAARLGASIFEAWTHPAEVPPHLLEALPEVVGGEPAPAMPADLAEWLRKRAILAVWAGATYHAVVAPFLPSPPGVKDSPENAEES